MLAIDGWTGDEAAVRRAGTTAGASGRGDVAPTGAGAAAVGADERLCARLRDALGRRGLALEVTSYAGFWPLAPGEAAIHACVTAAQGEVVADGWGATLAAALQAVVDRLRAHGARARHGAAG